MAFIFILYTIVTFLVLVVIYLIIDYYQKKRSQLDYPRKLQLELNKKIQIQKEQQMKLTILWKTQKNIEERVVQIDEYLKNLLEIPMDSEFDKHSAQVMELNTRFTIDQINKSMNFIQEMKSQENK